MVTIAGGIVLGVIALVVLVAMFAVACHIIIDTIAEFLEHPIMCSIALAFFAALAGGIIWAIAQ